MIFLEKKIKIWYFNIFIKKVITFGKVNNDKLFVFIDFLYINDKRNRNSPMEI